MSVKQVFLIAFLLYVQHCNGSELLRECREKTIFLFSGYYQLEILKIFDRFYPSKVYINNNAIRYSVNSTIYKFEGERDRPTEDTIPSDLNVIHDRVGEIYIQNGKLYLGNNDKPTLLYDNKNIRVNTLTMDPKGRLLFIRTDNNTAMALKLEHLKRYKKKCNMKLVPNLGTDILTMSLDTVTGNVLFGARSKLLDQGYLIIAKKMLSDPCSKYQDLTTVFKGKLEHFERIIKEKVRKPESVKYPRSIQQYLDDILNAFKESFQKMSNNESTVVANLNSRIEEQQQEVTLQRDSRLLLGKQLMLLKNSLDELPKNASTPFTTRYAPTAVPVEDEEYYECALISEFQENESTIKNTNKVIEQISENLQVLMNDALSENELNDLYSEVREE